MSPQNTPPHATTHAPDADLEGQVIFKPKTATPPLYKVLLLNDDFTPMDFVVAVLRHFFGKSFEEATQIMLAVHRRGAGLCGIYPREIAEVKAHQVMIHARQQNHPLQCRIEKE